MPTKLAKRGAARPKPRGGCAGLLRLNALVTPGAVHQFDPFPRDFCLTDVVLDLWTFPEQLASKAQCGVWLVTPGASEILFQCTVQAAGRAVHLESGIHCPRGSYLTANAGIFAQGATGDLRVLLSGRFC